ncbi:Translation factor guf1 mitochondrial [Chamberlinius hualienensis]
MIYIQYRNCQRLVRCNCKRILRTIGRSPAFLKTFSTSTSVYKGFGEEEKIDLSQFKPEYIRNFSIIAHVDHGKSTLADRLLETTGTIPVSSGNKQVLDKLQVEKERGITVKAQTASIFYTYKGQKYLLNMIDTPGHVDFNYEVFRSLAACQGVILLVDANQGVQAQTVANFYLAFGLDLVIIPALNKVDLKNAKPDLIARQMEAAFEFSPQTILRVSAKFGTGVEELLHAIIERIPPPCGDITKPLKCLVFDSWFDRIQGGILQVAIKDGKIKSGDEIVSCNTQKSYQIKNVGVLRVDQTPAEFLYAGQVGYLSAGIRNLKEIQIGDTFHLNNFPVEPLGSFKPAKAMVYAGIFPLDQTQLQDLRTAIEKLTLNDSSVTISIETSPALGQGWRLGFLGLLHMEVFNQRLSQEYDTEVIVTAPSVPYKVKLSSDKQAKLLGAEEIIINNPLAFPDPKTISQCYEPMVIGTVITPQLYYGKVMSLCLSRRGVQTDSKQLDESTLIMQFRLPLSEVIVDFFDELKSVTSGYASFDYEEHGYELAELGKLSILLNGKEVEEFTTIVPAVRARKTGQHLALRLKETLPQQQYQIAIQAVYNHDVVARSDIKALRKDVTAKLYGGDITRRQKLLARQSEGKKRLRMVGNVAIPRDTFIKVLRKS